MGICFTQVAAIYTVRPGRDWFPTTICWHYLSEANAHLQQFHDPLCAAAGSEFPTTRNGDAEARIASQVREMAEGSIARHMLSDVPVGVFLSGGIDSSALVALLAPRCPGLTTFSITFSEQDYSEARYSRLVAKTFKTDHHELTVDQWECLASLPDAILPFGPAHD